MDYMKKLFLTMIAVVAAVSALRAADIDYRSSRVRFYVPYWDVATPLGDVYFGQVRSKGTHFFALIERADGHYAWKSWNWGAVLYGYANGLHGQKLNREQAVRQLNSLLWQWSDTRIETAPNSGFWDLQLMDGSPCRTFSAMPGFNGYPDLNITTESLGNQYCTVSGDLDIPLWTTADGQYALFCHTGEIQADYSNSVLLIEFPMDEALPDVGNSGQRESLPRLSGDGTGLRLSGVPLGLDLRTTVIHLSSQGFTECADETVDEVYDELNAEMGGLLGDSRNDVVMAGKHRSRQCTITLFASPGSGKVCAIRGSFDRAYAGESEAEREFGRLVADVKAVYFGSGQMERTSSGLPQFVLHFEDGDIRYWIEKNGLDGNYAVCFDFMLSANAR